jgi:hypothetical protein
MGIESRGSKGKHWERRTSRTERAIPLGEHIIPSETERIGTISPISQSVAERVYEMTCEDMYCLGKAARAFFRDHEDLGNATANLFERVEVAEKIDPVVAIIGVSCAYLTLQEQAKELETTLPSISREQVLSLRESLREKSAQRGDRSYVDFARAEMQELEQQDPHFFHLIADFAHEEFPVGSHRDAFFYGVIHTYYPFAPEFPN